MLCFPALGSQPVQKDRAGIRHYIKCHIESPIQQPLSHLSPTPRNLRRERRSQTSGETTLINVSFHAQVPNLKSIAHFRRKYARSVKTDKTSFMDDDDVDDDYDDFSREFMVNADSKNIPAEDRGDGKSRKLPSEDTISCHANVESGLSSFFVDASINALNLSSHESIPSLLAVGEQPKQAFRAPIDDTQDPFSGSHTSASQDEFPDDSPKSPLKKFWLPPYLL